MEEESSTPPPETDNGQCEMCANYEVSLQTLQTAQDTLREQLAAAKELYEKYGKELSEERLYRKELEGRFAALNDEIEQKIQIFTDSVNRSEERIALLAKKQETDLADLGHELDVAKERQASQQTELKMLYERYQRMLHKNAQKAEEMREQCIDLPQTVDELTLLALQLREELISEKASREHECQELRDELTVAREQMLESEQQLLIYAQHAQQQQEHMEQLLQQHRIPIGAEDESGGRSSSRNSSSRRQHAAPPPVDMHSSNAVRSPREQRRLQQQPHTANHQHQPTVVEVGDADCCCPDAKCHQLTVELERRLHRSMNERARLQELLVEQRNKCTQMQSELDTSEAVQKDFVRLSQNLQVELEKIRQSECEVRWQDEQDIDRCNDCALELQPGPEHRINCRHCGKIFCSSCTSNSVCSGPAKRAVPVCVLCHTLLFNKEHSLVDRLNGTSNSYTGAAGGGGGGSRGEEPRRQQQQQEQC